MPAYVIASVTEAHDDEALAEYRRRNSEAVAAHGGRFLARGGEMQVLEGSWSPLRQGASTTDIILVDGV